ncbi:MAG: ATP-binding protein [Gemmatimonadales bacterium]
MPDTRPARPSGAFLLEFSDSLRTLGNPNQVQSAATRLLLERLSVDRVLYADIQADGETTVIDHDACREGIISAAGRYQLSNFGEHIREGFRAGKTLVAHDVPALKGLSDIEQLTYAQVGIAAYIAVPLLREGRLRAFLAVHQGEPRRWQGEEVELVEEVASRTWAAVEWARAESALRTSEARYRSLFENMAEGLTVAELVRDEQGTPVDFRYLMANTALERLTGFPPEGVVGRLGSEVAPHDLASRLAIYVEVVKTGRIARYKFENPAIERWFDLSVFPYGGDQFEVLYGDITDQVLAERSNQEAARRKDEFLATLAHELRNPLAPIRQAAAIASSPNVSAWQLRWSLDVIERQVHHMGLLLDDLLDVSRITRGQLELHRRAVRVREVIDAALETAHPMLEERLHRVDVRVDRDPPVLDADPLRVSQILANLLTNAARYTPEKGHVDIEAHTAGGMVEIRVTDNGIGIRPELLEGIFDLFSQGQRPSAGGLGIGLALARGLAELHGGSLRAESAGPDRGSTFIVRLPAAAAAPVPEVPRPAPSGGVVPRRVLVVDDNVDAAETLAELLRLRGHRVETAHDGHAGLVAATRFRPEVALIDLSMPEMDGFELARAIRAGEGGADVRLYAVTGLGQERDRERALAAGFDDHLTKPVTPARVLDLLAKEKKVGA